MHLNPKKSKIKRNTGQPRPPPANHTPGTEDPPTSRPEIGLSLPKEFSVVSAVVPDIDFEGTPTLKFETPIDSPKSIDSTRIEALLGAVLTSIDHLKVDISSVKSNVDAHGKALDLLKMPNAGLREFSHETPNLVQEKPGDPTNVIKLANSMTSRPRQTAPIHRQLTPFENPLKILDLDHVIDFLNKLVEYEQTKETLLVIQAYISEDIRVTLAAAMEPPLTPWQFLHAERNDVLDVLRAEVQPNSTEEFKNRLKEPIDMQWPKNYELTLINYKPAYNSFLILKNKFMGRLEFMAHGNSVAPPMVHDKEDGLIHIFLSHLKKTKYPQRVWESKIDIDRKKTYRTKDLSGFYGFLRDLYAEFALHLEFSKRAIDCDSLITGGIKMQRQSVEPDRKTDPLKLLFPTGSGNQKPALNRIDEETDLTSIKSDATVLSFDTTLGHTHNTDMFQALTADGKGPCFAKTIHNECLREKTGQCRYDHSEEALRNLWLQLDANLKKSNYRPNTYQASVVPSDPKLPTGRFPPRKPL